MLDLLDRISEKQKLGKGDSLDRLADKGDSLDRLKGLPQFDTETLAAPWMEPSLLKKPEPVRREPGMVGITAPAKVPTPAVSRIEPFAEDIKRLPAELGKGLAAGIERMLGIPGTAAQYAGEKYQQPISRQMALGAPGVQLVQMIADRTGHAGPAKLFDWATKKLTKEGKRVADFWDEQATKGWEAPSPELMESRWGRPLQYGARVVGEAAPTFGVAIGVGVVTGNPNLSLALMGAFEKAHSYRTQRKQGASFIKADIISDLSGSWEAITEKIPMDYIFKGKAASKLTKFVASGTLEGAQEVAAEMGQNFLEYFGYKLKDWASIPSAIKEGWKHVTDNISEAAVGGFVLGGGAGVAIPGRPGVVPTEKPPQVPVEPTVTPEKAAEPIAVEPRKEVAPPPEVAKAPVKPATPAEQIAKGIKAVEYINSVIDSEQYAPLSREQKVEIGKRMMAQVDPVWEGLKELTPEAVKEHIEGKAPPPAVKEKITPVIEPEIGVKKPEVAEQRPAKPEAKIVPKFKEGDAVQWERKGESRTAFVGKPKLVKEYDGIERYHYPVGVGKELITHISEEYLSLAPEGTKAKPEAVEVAPAKAEPAKVPKEIIEGWLPKIRTKLIEREVKNLSDAELKRAFKGTAAENRLIEYAKLMRESGDLKYEDIAALKKVEPTKKPKPKPLKERDILGGVEPFSQIRQALEKAKRVRPETLVKQTETLKKRVSAAAGALKRGVEKGTPAERAIYESTGLLKGPLTEYEQLYDSIRDVLRPEVIDEAFLSISNNPALRYFEVLNTATAFKKLIDGNALTPGEAQLIKNHFGLEWGKLAQKRIPLGEKIWRIITQIANIPITSLATADISGVGRQAKPLGLANPKEYGKMIIDAHKAFFSEKSAKQLIEEYKNDPYYEEAKKMGLELTVLGEKAAEAYELEERFIAAPLLEQVPGIRIVVRASERAFVAPLNYLRMAVYSKLRTAAKQSGKTLTTKQLRDITSSINDLSGRSSIGRGKAARKLAPLGAAFFSPRFAISRIKAPITFVRPALKSLAKLQVDPSLKLTSKALAGMIGMNLAIMLLVKWLWPDDTEVEMDLRSSDGGKLKIGNTRIDLWSGYLQPVQLFVRLASGQRKSQSGHLYEVNRTELVQTFGRSKSAPLVGLLIDAWTGQTFFGAEVGAAPRGKISKYLEKKQIPKWVQGTGKEFWNRLTPLVIQDAIDALVDEGYPMAVLAGSLAFYGTGVQTYEMWPSAKLQAIRNSISQKVYGKKWDQLRIYQQKTLKQRKEIVEADLESKRERRKLGPTNFGRYFLRDIQKSTERIQKRLPRKLQTELEIMAMTTGGISRRVERDFYLNDKRYEAYEDYVVKELKSTLVTFVNSPTWPKLPISTRAQVAGDMIRKAKDRARKRLVVNIEAGSL